MSGADVEPWSASFSERYARDLYHCSNCSYCVDAIWPQRGIDHVCVTLEQHSRAPSYSARGYIEAARAIAEGAAIDASRLAERVFTCTTCGNCETVCPIGLRPAGIVRALRAELVEQAAVPAPIEALRLEILEQGNPYGQPRERRAAWSAARPSEPGSTVMFFAGCAAGVAVPEEARAALRVLERAGERPALPLSDTQCCGAPLSELGYEAQGTALARGLGVRLACGPQQRFVVAGCECRAHLADHTDLVPVSFAGWLCDAHAAGDVLLAAVATEPAPVRVRLLESCQLKSLAGRAGTADEQRIAQLFGALGIEVVNSAFPRAHALCCGAAGGMPRMQPAAAARMAQARLADGKCSIAGTVTVTLDSRCAQHLRAAAATSVLGLAEFVDRYVTVTPAGHRNSEIP